MQRAIGFRRQRARQEERVGGNEAALRVGGARQAAIAELLVDDARGGGLLAGAHQAADLSLRGEGGDAGIRFGGGDAAVCGGSFGQCGRAAFQAAGVGPVGALLEGIGGRRRERRGIGGCAVTSQDDDGIGCAGADRQIKRGGGKKVGGLAIEHGDAIFPNAGEALGEELSLGAEVGLVCLFDAAAGEFLLGGERVVHEPENADGGRQHTDEQTEQHQPATGVAVRAAELGGELHLGSLMVSRMGSKIQRKVAVPC